MIMPDPCAFMRFTCDLFYLWTCSLELGQVVNTQAQDLTDLTLHRLWSLVTGSCDSSH